jgi:hypothetical protein
VALVDDKQMKVEDTLDELMVEKILFEDSENIQKIEK